METRSRLEAFKLRLYETIFEADTLAGRIFDLTLLILIVTSVGVIVLESVEAFRVRFSAYLVPIEWFFTIIFTLEYLARLWTVKNKEKYMFSFFGVVDLMSFLPSYLALFFAGTHAFMVIRTIRLLRIFRILKLTHFVGEGQNLVMALKASRYKIIVFLFTVVTTVIIMGTMMYMIEGPDNGFTSIPRGIYWSIVTMTTIGYGDIVPHTDLGQMLASILMILGYGVIAVPTGIVSAEMVSMKSREKLSRQTCPHCLKEGHDSDAVYCKFCGGMLN